ncbi:MAG: clostripain-related cysteine peptidase [Candidatus Xenobia bacterium]
MAKHSFDSLAQVGSSDQVNLVAQYGLPKQDVIQGRIEAGQGTTHFVNAGDCDMGSGKNLQQFIEWGMKKYPAEHYALVLWDHGAGFEGSCVDEEKNHLITNQDLRDALDAAYQDTGNKMQVVGFNACLMNQVETAYELRNSASYMVGSEETEAGLRLPLPGVFGTAPQHTIARDVETAVKQRGDLSPEELARLMVFDAKAQFGASMFTPTQAAIDLSKMNQVKDQANNLAGLLLEAMQKDPKLVDQLRHDVKHTQHFLAMDSYILPYNDYRDLGDFVRVIEKDPKFAGDPRVKSTCNQLKAAIKDAVIAEWHAPESSMGGKSLEGATGLSVYLTPHYGFDKAGKSAIDNIPQGGTHGHEKTSFAQDTQWDQMLKAIAKDDDMMGKIPPGVNRAIMPYTQLLGFEGYNYAWQAATGSLGMPMFELWPLMSFPYVIPVPGVVGCAAGAVGGLLRTEHGVTKLAEGIERKDSPTANRTRLAVDGAIDVAVGLGSAFTCGAMLTGFGSVAAPVAMGVLALGLGRMAFNVGAGLYKSHQAKNMSIDQKLAATQDMRPNLHVDPLPAPSLAPATPVAPSAPTLKPTPILG